MASRSTRLASSFSNFNISISAFNVQRSTVAFSALPRFLFLSPTKQRQSVGSDHLRSNGECSFFFTRECPYDPMTASATKLPTSSRLSFTFRILPPSYTIILHDRNMTSTVAALPSDVSSPQSGRPSSLSPDPASHFHADHTLPESA